jgi:hypothetical protein
MIPDTTWVWRSNPQFGPKDDVELSNLHFTFNRRKMKNFTQEQ